MTSLKYAFAAALAAGCAFGGGAWDANVADFPRLAGEKGDSARIMRAVEKAGTDGVVWFPRGEYDIDEMLYVTNRCSLLLHSAAHLVARAKMNYVLFWDGAADYHALSVYRPDGSVYDNANLFIKGGDIDGNGLASCLALANAHHFTLADVTLHNGLKSGLCVTRETGGHLYELIANNVYCKCTMSGLAGNVGIDCQVADSHFTDCIVVDYTKGIRTAGGANRFTRCHVWGGTVPPKGMGFREWSDFYARRKRLEASGKWTAEEERAACAKGVPEMLPGSTAFECIGDANVFDGCYADTAEIGYDVHRGATIVNSGFFNNPRMNLRKSTAIVHRGGHLRVAFCDFRGAANCERLYAGSGKNVEWLSSGASGGDGMAADAARLADGTFGRPRYAWRGYMLDVSRHFFTVDEVKRTLDLMHEHGLNVFHWHLTDHNGWRLEIDRYPKLTSVGAVRKASSKRSSTMFLDVVDGDYGPYFYTKDQVRDIVRYAAARGIRIVPEIDIPGHSGAAISAYPELGCTGIRNCSELCLGKESTFEMYENILDEVAELFPGEVIHIGGDECSGANWKKCPDCQSRIKELGLKSSHDLQGWATKRFAAYLEKKGRRLMGWDELATWDDLPRSVIIQSYRGATYGVAAAKKGFDVVMSPDTFCYLDYVQGLDGDPEEYQPFGVFLDVAKIARFDPCEGVPEECRGHILGGQGNLWTELVVDQKGAEWRTWPRLAALAEVLRNGPAKDVPAFMARMQTVRDGLVRRGVNAAPLGPLFKPVPDLLPGARYESLKSENGKRLDFAKMLDNPLNFSVLQFDLNDRRDSFRRVFATRDASMEKGSYRLDLEFDRISMSAADDDGFRRGLEQLKALARPKRGGVMEFTGAVIVGGAQ